MQEMQEMGVLSLPREDPLEEGMATHSSLLVWRIPWTEEPGELQSMGSQRVGHNWSDGMYTLNKGIKYSIKVINKIAVFSKLLLLIIIIILIITIIIGRSSIVVVKKETLGSNKPSQDLALPLTNSMILGNLLYFSQPQFHHIKKVYRALWMLNGH